MDPVVVVDYGPPMSVPVPKIFGSASDRGLETHLTVSNHPLLIIVLLITGRLAHVCGRYYNASIGVRTESFGELLKLFALALADNRRQIQDSGSASLNAPNTLITDTFTVSPFCTCGLYKHS